jgi:hypothetical protein
MHGPSESEKLITKGHLSSASSEERVTSKELSDGQANDADLQRKRGLTELREPRDLQHVCTTKCSENGIIFICGLCGL